MRCRFLLPHKWVDDGMVAMQSRAVVGRTTGVCRRGLLCFAGLLAVLGLVFSLALPAPWWRGRVHAQEPTATTVSPTDTPEATEAPSPTASPREIATATETPVPTETATETPTPTPRPCPARRYTALYEKHAPEVARILAADPVLAARAAALLRQWQPAVKGLVAMERGAAVSPAATKYRVTAREVAAARAVLETLAGRGSPALQADLKPVLAQLDGFVGRTPMEIWTALESAAPEQP